MKCSMNWMIVPTALAAVFTIVTTASADTVQTPLASPITVSGSSGQVQSECGFNAGSPTQVVVVNQPTPLRFTVEGQGQPTLWIKGPVNRCVMTPGSSINVPGVWEQGTYSVFVGNLAEGSHPYTLSIIPEN